MQYFQFQLPNGTSVQTCPAALGYAFAAGTTDGPGPFDFTQNEPGTPTANPLWALVSKALKDPTPQQAACQQPKPILLDTGELTWLLRVGQMILIISPSEVTTMSGRRWKSAISAAAITQNITQSAPIVVLGSPANTYAHYLTTPEEYGVQRYEGASTLYGPWELPAYINLTVSNIHYLSSSSTNGPAQGVLPPDNRNNSLSFISPVIQDNPPIGKSFGQTIVETSSAYTRGAVINATFVGANPRNNLRLEGTYTAVEQLQGSNWVQVLNDWDWYLSLTWTRDDTILGTSHVVVSWETQQSDQPGTYRLRYFGDEKPLIGSVSSFEGSSGNFTLT
jgi:neutral ceramidase